MMRQLSTVPKCFFALMSGAILLMMMTAQTNFGQTPIKPATTEQNKGLKISILDENDKIFQSFVLPVDEAVSEKAVLAKTFKQTFKAQSSFKIKVENQTARAWSFFLHNAKPGKMCYSVLPLGNLEYPPVVNSADIPVEELAPRDSSTSKKLPVASGEQKFVILASPSADRLRDVFLSVEFLAGMTTGRGTARERDLSPIDALELKQGNVKGKGSIRDSNSQGGSRITITLGNVYSRSGDALKSADFYDSLLLIAACRFQDKSGNDSNRKVPFNALAVGWLNNQGLANYQTGTLGAAKANYEEALARLKELRASDSRPHRAEEVVILTNLAQVYATLDDQPKAIEIYKAALAVLPWVSEEEEPDEVKQNRYVAIYNGFGTSYEDLGDFKMARKHYEDALAIETRLDLKASAGITLNSLARLAAEENDFALAEKLFQQAKSLSIETGNQAGIASAHNNLGWLYVRLKKYEEARENFHSSSDIFRRLKNRTAQATALGNLMFVENLLQHPRLAVFYGKQAINLLQSVRGEISTVEKQLQKSFLLSREETYRKLSDILIAEGRIIEAEQILQMLKQEEVFDYLRRNASDADKLQQRADLNNTEADALARSNEVSDNIASLGQEFGALRELRSRGATLTPEQDRRYNELSAQIKEANRAFQVFLSGLSGEVASRAGVTRDLQENLAIKSDLKSLGNNLAFLYTLVGADRYRVILITPDAQVNGKTEITAEELDKKITAFRAAVQKPLIDPRPLGKELYDIIIKPIEKQLDGAKSKTLLWSLDGNLRLLPLAALWDGQQYFGQKYQNIVITLASRLRLGSEISKEWRALGLGVSEGKSVVEPNGTREMKFEALPKVKIELASIIQNNATEMGVLPGQRLLDSEFNEDEVKNQLASGGYKVVHIASHFSLNAGDATKSFLLLGDGRALTVDEIKNNPEIDFNGVELLTLSACQTAVVEKDSNGKEIEGFGYVAQQKGAKAILATLWSVADESTQLLMSEFYRLHKANPEMTKAQALQRAQAAMLAGELKPANSQSGCRSAGLSAGGLKKAGYPCDPKAPFAHPFYWSPFVLIGNWR